MHSERGYRGVTTRRLDDLSPSIEFKPPSFCTHRLPYKDLFGGVTGLTESNVRKINGFPNVYWGWGGEDDEILMRVRKAGLRVASRPKGDRRFTGFYKVIEHHHHSAPKIAERYGLQTSSDETMAQFHRAVVKRENLLSMKTLPHYNRGYKPHCDVISTDFDLIRSILCLPSNKKRSLGWQGDPLNRDCLCLSSSILMLNAAL